MAYGPYGAYAYSNPGIGALTPQERAAQARETAAKRREEALARQAATRQGAVQRREEALATQAAAREAAAAKRTQDEAARQVWTAYLQDLRALNTQLRQGVLHPGSPEPSRPDSTGPANLVAAADATIRQLPVARQIAQNLLAAQQARDVASVVARGGTVDPYAVSAGAPSPALSPPVSSSVKPVPMPVQAFTRSEAAQIQQLEERAVPEEVEARVPRWLWIAGGVVVIGGVAMLLWRRRRRKST